MDRYQSATGGAPGSASASASASRPPPPPLQMGARGAYLVRLLTVGDSGSGKTSLVQRYDRNVFSTRVDITLGVDYWDKTIKLEGVQLRLQLWDTAGQERFRSLTNNFFGKADGCVVTFDVTSRPSFDHVVGWMRDVQERAPNGCEAVLCGNKADLESDRVVTADEARQLADTYGVPYFETSALTGQNVEKMFTTLAASIKRRRIDVLDGSTGNGDGTTRGALNGGLNTNSSTRTTDGGGRAFHLDNNGPGREQGTGMKSASCC